MLIPIAACIGLGALSLLLPSEPSYDPWAWFVWSREIAGLELGRPAERRTLARTGSFDVYRRIGVSYRLFTPPLQGIHIRSRVAGSRGAG
jgi:hypothetical protein